MQQYHCGLNCVLQETFGCWRSLQDRVLCPFALGPQWITSDLHHWYPGPSPPTFFHSTLPFPVQPPHLHLHWAFTCTILAQAIQQVSCKDGSFIFTQNGVGNWKWEESSEPDNISINCCYPTTMFGLLSRHFPVLSYSRLGLSDKLENVACSVVKTFLLSKYCE